MYPKHGFRFLEVPSRNGFIRQVEQGFSSFFCQNFAKLDDFSKIFKFVQLAFKQFFDWFRVLTRFITMLSKRGGRLSNAKNLKPSALFLYPCNQFPCQNQYGSRHSSTVYNKIDDLGQQQNHHASTLPIKKRRAPRHAYSCCLPLPVNLSGSVVK